MLSQDAVDKTIALLASFTQNPPEISAAYVEEYRRIAEAVGLQSDQALQNACTAFLGAGNRFFPKNPGELVKALQAAGETNAEAAWHRARDLVREHGSYASFGPEDFEGDAAALAAFASVGPETIGGMSPDKSGIVRSEFVNAYKAALSGGIAVGRIVGAWERDAKAKGLDTRDPKLRGRALDVYKGSQALPYNIPVPLDEPAKNNLGTALEATKAEMLEKVEDQDA